jgi:hypothetical protein
MSLKRKIGWQKYEDIIESQINSPLLNTILSNISKKIEDDPQYENSSSYEDQEETEEITSTFPVSDKMLEDITMLTNFECWMGHTNFDITETIKTTLDKTEGIELLKICSRYRFFIGIGKMFEFKNVRKLIEERLIDG